MNLNTLIDRATIVAGIALVILVLTTAFGGGTSFLFLLSAIIGGLALQVLLLAVIANAMVNTLKKKEK